MLNGSGSGGGFGRGFGRPYERTEMPGTESPEQYDDRPDVIIGCAARKRHESEVGV